MNRLERNAEVRSNRQLKSCDFWWNCLLATIYSLLLSWESSAKADTLLDKSFDTEVSGVSAFLEAYPEFSLTDFESFGGQPSIEVPDDHVLHLSGGGTNFGVQLSSISIWSEVSVRIGRINVGPAVSGNVGIVLGDNVLVFHPGFVGDDGTRGAFRVQGPGGFFNRDMGFLPEPGVLHELTVTSDGFGNFKLTLTDGLDPNNQYTNTWFNPGAVDGLISLLAQR